LLFFVLIPQNYISYVLQAHPDKQLGPILHQKYPTVYKDPNHKPEMAIALTPFEAMCGFRTVSDIKRNIKRYPELSAVIGPSGL